MRAIILAAGQGLRLRPLTDQLPKCLIAVDGKPILQHQLESLDQIGIQSCVIVVGYRSKQVQECFGDRFRGIWLTYVQNPHYNQTNNLYSLWLARGDLSDDLIILDGDLVFEEGLLKDIKHHMGTNVVVADRWVPNMDGTLVLTDGAQISSMILKKDQPKGFDATHTLKTINIYLISRPTAKEHFLPGLEAKVQTEAKFQFYEAVLADLIANDQIQMTVHRTGNRKWVEIDTPSDLALAELLFGNHKSDQDSSDTIK